MKKIFLFFIFYPIISFAQIEFIEDLEFVSKSTSDLFRGITTIKIRVPSDHVDGFSSEKYMYLTTKTLSTGELRTGFTSNLANGLANYFDNMYFKVEITKSTFEPNNCETLYLDLSDINLAIESAQKRTLESTIKLPVYNCSEEFELIGEFKLKKKSKDFWNKRLFYNEVRWMLESSSIFSFEESKRFGFRTLLDRKDLETEKVLHLNNKKIALDNRREAEKMFKEYWAGNFFSGDPIEGIYEQTSYYQKRTASEHYGPDPFWQQRFKIIITLDDSKEFYNIFYLYNTSSKNNFNIGDPLGRIYKTDILNNFDLEYSLDSSKKFNSKKKYRSIKVAFGGYKTIGDGSNYEISNDDYYYFRYLGHGGTRSSSRPSLSSRNIESYLKNSNGFFVFYDSDENDWEFNAYFQKLFSPKKLARPSNLKKKKTVTKRRYNTTKKSKKTAVKKAPPPAAKRKD